MKKLFILIGVATVIGLLLGLGILWLEFGSVEESFTVFHPEPVPEGE
ncbi:MAG: hypothetical protein ACR2NP_03465 [Pirellulaceae bacterium]